VLVDQFPDFDFASVHAIRSRPEAGETATPSEFDEMLLEGNWDDLSLIQRANENGASRPQGNAATNET
jgi:hypothetical protein